MATSNSAVYGTYTISTNGLSLGMDTGSRPEPPPKGLIVTRGVQTKAGWIGQVIVDKEIIFETEPHEDSDEAMEEVNGYVVGRIKKLFAPKSVA
jgi:hypothetical protein